MNNSIKVILTIQLEGYLSHETREEKIHWEKSDNFDPKKIIARGVCSNLVRIPSVATKRLRISEDAYDNFIGDMIPASLKSFSKDKAWKSMSDAARLEYHLNEIAEGRPYTFEVLD